MCRNTMAKRDPYNTVEKWNKWKQRNQNGIKNISKYNSSLILEFLHDMEMGKNVASVAIKGERSPIRLLALKSRMIFFAKHFKDINFNEITKDQIHQFFYDMRHGILLKSNGGKYADTGSYVKDFKTFWGWLLRVGKTKNNITNDLQRSNQRKPAWVYLTEAEFKKLANHANADYRALAWLMYDSGMRVTEAYSIKVCDFSKNYTQLNVRQEYAKTFGRVIQLKLCSQLIRDYVKYHALKPEDHLFLRKPCSFNKYLRTLAEKTFGKNETLARESYDKMTLYDIRHNASCYWLKRYPTNSGLMYRMGWSEEKEVRYYSEFLGQADSICDDDMITTEQKNAYVKRIESLEKKEQKINEMMEELLMKINELEMEVHSNKGATESSLGNLSSPLCHNIR